MLRGVISNPPFNDVSVPFFPSHVLYVAKFSSVCLEVCYRGLLQRFVTGCGGSGKIRGVQGLVRDPGDGEQRAHHQPGWLQAEAL